jgi:glutathione S-transferase
LSILEYISDVYLNGAGWPNDKNARAVARSVCAEMHSSFFNVRNEMPMNCRKKVNTIVLSQGAIQEINRIIFLWEKCRNQYGADGNWLFSTFSIADAMFAPIVLRFSSYSIPLKGLAAEYMEYILQQPELIAWINASREESEIIESCEITN